MSEAPTVVTSKKVKSPLLVGQREWVNDVAPLKIAEKSRRIGWTYAEAFDATSRRQKTPRSRNMDYWFSSADESAAAEFSEYCRFWQEDFFGGICDRFVEAVEDPDTKAKATAFVVRCPNGKRITAMSSNPRRFRSKGGDVALDEFAYHDRAREMYKAAQPSTMRGGWMRVFSTHNGEESEFNKFVQMAHQIVRAMGQDPKVKVPTDVSYAEVQRLAKSLKVMPWKLHRVTLLDAVEQGLVENINRFQGTQFTREGFVQKLRSDCVDEDMWNQEFMCIPSVGVSALLPYDLIERCEREELNGAVEGLLPLTGGPLYVGGDIGETNDPSVFWLLEGVGDVLVTRGVRWFKNVPFHIQQAALTEWLRLPSFKRCCLDAGGVGAGLAQEAERVFGAYRIERIKFTLPVKEELAMPLRRVFEDVTVRIPADARIRESLHKIRIVQTASHNLRFDATRDGAGHADEFWALALARHAAGSLGEETPVTAADVHSVAIERLGLARGGGAGEASFFDPQAQRAQARGHRSVGV